MGRHLRVVTAATLSLGLMSIAALAAEAPAEIKIGTLYASSGRYASISHAGPLRPEAVDRSEERRAAASLSKPTTRRSRSSSSPMTTRATPRPPATLYNQLITQDKVDLLVADSGSVLTSVAVPIARDHKMFLFDQTGTGAAFFTQDNPYIALMADPVSTHLAEAARRFPHP